MLGQYITALGFTDCPDEEGTETFNPHLLAIIHLWFHRLSR